MANRICFVELPAAPTGPAKSFYMQAFGFSMTDFGPTYSCTMTVKRAGGVITRQAFSFPGGRRFHFRDPAGNELAAMQADDKR